MVAGSTALCGCLLWLACSPRTSLGSFHGAAAACGTRRSPLPLPPPSRAARRRPKNSCARRAASAHGSDDAAAASRMDRIRQGLADAGGWEEWTRAVRVLVETVAMEPHEAEECLAVALQWKRWAIVTSPLARKFIRPVPPNATAVAASLQWLLRDGPLAVNSSGNSSNDWIKAAIMQYPEAYLIAPERNYEQAWRVAPDAYRQDANTHASFRDLVRRHPSAMQCTYNCADTGCNSECGNCWVSFAYQLAENSQQPQPQRNDQFLKE